MAAEEAVRVARELLPAGVPDGPPALAWADMMGAGGGPPAACADVWRAAEFAADGRRVLLDAGPAGRWSWWPKRARWQWGPTGPQVKPRSKTAAGGR